MRLKTKRKIKRALKSSKSYFVLIILLATVALISANTDLTQNSQNTGDFSGNVTANANADNTTSGENVFRAICMKCHTSPERYKSFTLYFGKTANTWEVGVRKMISAGNVKLSDTQIKAVARYLEETYR